MMKKKMKKKLYLYNNGGKLCIKLLNYKKITEGSFSGKNL